MAALTDTLIVGVVITVVLLLPAFLQGEEKVEEWAEEGVSWGWGGGGEQAFSPS